MVTKLTPRILKKHNNSHREFYESKLEMMVCGCGNRRELTDQERLQYGLIVYSKQTQDMLMQIISQDKIPERK